MRRRRRKKEVNDDFCILSIDPASQLGWAFSRTEYGTWDLRTRKDESIGMKLLRLKGKLNEMYAYKKFELLVYERPGGRHAGAVIHQSKLIGCMEEWCAANQVEFRAYASTEIKKYATNKGNCGKPAMIQAAKDKLGYPEESNDDNEADALWLLELAKRDLGIK